MSKKKKLKKKCCKKYKEKKGKHCKRCPKAEACALKMKLKMVA